MNAAASRLQTNDPRTTRTRRCRRRCSGRWCTWKGRSTPRAAAWARSRSPTATARRLGARSACASGGTRDRARRATPAARDTGAQPRHQCSRPGQCSGCRCRIQTSTVQTNTGGHSGPCSQGRGTGRRLAPGPEIDAVGHCEAAAAPGQGSSEPRARGRICPRLPPAHPAAWRRLASFCWCIVACALAFMAFAMTARRGTGSRGWLGRGAPPWLKVAGLLRAADVVY